MFISMSKFEKWSFWTFNVKCLYNQYTLDEWKKSYFSFVYKLVCDFFVLACWNFEICIHLIHTTCVEFTSIQKKFIVSIFRFFFNCLFTLNVCNVRMNCWRNLLMFWNIIRLYARHEFNIIELSYSQYLMLWYLKFCRHILLSKFLDLIAKSEKNTSINLKFVFTKTD